MNISCKNSFIMNDTLINTINLLRQFRAFLISIKPNFYKFEQIKSAKYKCKKIFPLMHTNIFQSIKGKKLPTIFKKNIHAKKNYHIHKTNNPVKIHSLNPAAICLQDTTTPPLFLKENFLNIKKIRTDLKSNIYKKSLRNNFFLLNYLKLAPLTFVPQGASIFFKNKENIISKTKNLLNKIKIFKNKQLSASKLTYLRKTLNLTKSSTTISRIINTSYHKKPNIINQNINITLNAENNSDAKELASEIEQRIIPVLAKEIGLKS